MGVWICDERILYPLKRWYWCKMISIKNGRVLLGAFALVLTGIIVSVMMHLYTSGYYGISAIALSRWWWEIIMNLQILAIGCVWFCYANLIQGPASKRVYFMRIRFSIALFSVMVPLWTVLLSVLLDWFEKPPPLIAIDYILGGMLFIWCVSIVIPRAGRLRARDAEISFLSLWRAGKPIRFVTSLPLIVLVILIVSDAVFETSYYYVYMPVLLYMQAAVPFIQKGIVRKRKSPLKNSA